MKSKFFLLIAIIIIGELIGISLLGVHTYKKYNTASMISVSPIERERITFSESSELEDFFELAPMPPDAYVPPWLPYKPEFLTNSDMLNERYEYTIKKPQDTFRIITLGDSWTYGQFVHTKDNFSEVLEDSLNSTLACRNIKKFEVINLGVPDYDIRYAVERFKVRGEKYNPDLVLWFLINNDFEEIRDFVKPRYDFYIAQMRASGELAMSENAFSNAVNQFEKPREAWKKALEDQDAQFGEEKIMRYQEKALHSIDDYYNKSLLIFTLSFKEKFNQIIEKFVESRKNTYFLKHGVFEYGDKFQLPDSHPNKEGHALIAKNLLNYITKTNIIPCD